MSTENSSVPSDSNTKIFQNEVSKNLFLIFSLIVLLCDILTCMAMKKTKRIPFASKLLTCVTLICDSVFLFIILTVALLQFIHVPTTSSELLNAVFGESGKVCIVFSWLAVTIMSLERIVCLYFPNWYSRNASKRNITACLSVCMFVTIFIKIAMYLLVILLTQEKIDFQEATRTSPQMLYFLATFLTINTLCYIATLLLVKKLSRVIENSQGRGGARSLSHTFAFTRNITCIMLVFKLVHVPLFVCLTLPLGGEGSRKTYLTVLFMLVMCAVNPLLYAWRFKECRFILFKSMTSGCGIFSNRGYFSNQVEAMRQDVYDIRINR